MFIRARVPALLLLLMPLLPFTQPSSAPVTTACPSALQPVAAALREPLLPAVDTSLSAVALPAKVLLLLLPLLLGLAPFMGLQTRSREEAAGSVPLAPPHPELLRLFAGSCSRCSFYFTPLTLPTNREASSRLSRLSS